MVGVAQLVELRIVTPAVAGSSPVIHPIQRTVNNTYVPCSCDVAGVFNYFS